MTERLLAEVPSCKDAQALLLATHAGEEEYLSFLLSRYSTLRNVLNRLCHLETRCPQAKLPELDHTQTPPTVPVCNMVTFEFGHPINDINNRRDEGDTYTIGYDAKVYSDATTAAKYEWLTDIDTWNRFQRRMKRKTPAEIERIRADWRRKIEDGTWCGHCKQQLLDNPDY